MNLYSKFLTAKSHSKKVKISPLKKSENISLLEKEFNLFRVNFHFKNLSFHKKWDFTLERVNEDYFFQEVIVFSFPWSEISLQEI